MQSEVQRLENVAKDSLYTTMSNTMMIEYCFKVFKRYFKEGSILEMGPAEGVMTQYLNTITKDLEVLDGSSIFCDSLKERFPGMKVHNELFESFEPGRQYDNIVLGHVLEHVDNPVQILEIVKKWLSKDGRILAAVPNSQSLHRQAAVIMELMPSEDAMSELDYHHGHRRIYNPFSFRSDFIKAGLKIEHYGGYWLKPISNSQIHATWTSEMLLAFMKLGERYPDIAGEIYVVAQL